MTDLSLLVLVYSLLSPPSGCLATADGGGFLFFGIFFTVIIQKIVRQTINA